MAHNYNTRHNPLVATNEENNVSDPQTSDLIIKLEKKILSRFDGLNKELLNLKDVIIKDLQVENQRLTLNIKLCQLKKMGIIWNSIEEETTWRLQEYQKK